MLCGGEALPRELAAPLIVKGSSLWNLYVTCFFTNETEKS